jgi:hypothetical protein
MWELPAGVRPGYPLQPTGPRGIDQGSKSLSRFHVDSAEFLAHAVNNHDNMVALLSTTATEGNFDPASAAMIAGLLGVREGHFVRLDVSLFQLSDADVFVAIVANNLNVVLVVTWR